MTATEALLAIKKAIEKSILETSESRIEAAKMGNYQAAANFEQQMIGQQIAKAFITDMLIDMGEKLDDT